MAIRIRCYPSTDRSFFDHMHHVAADVDQSEAEVPEVVARVESIVREHYPSVRISPRSSLAVLWGDEPAWYAYRDGRPDPGGPGSAFGRRARAIARAIRTAGGRQPAT